MAFWKSNRIPWILVTAWTNAAVTHLSNAAKNFGFLDNVITVYLCTRKEEETLQTACDYTLCVASKNAAWKTILESTRPVILFSTISKLGVQPTRHWSTTNSIVGRISAIFSDELTQTLRPPMLSLRRYQSCCKETSSLRSFFGDPRQLPCFAHSAWNQFSCMRTVSVAVQPIILSRQYRQVPILGDITSLFFYEGHIHTMRQLENQKCPLTVVLWDAENL